MASSLKVHTPITKKGITEKKQAELEALNIEVLHAKHDVEQLQVIVTSLTQKATIFNQLLANADDQKNRALQNKKLLDGLIQSTLYLKNNAGISLEQTNQADGKTKELAAQLKQLIDKLIYAAQLINRLIKQVIRKKALNPLISDDLVNMVSTSATEANNAVAITLIALKSSFAAQESIFKSEAGASVLCVQSLALYNLMTENNTGEAGTKNISLDELLNNICTNAKINYTQTQDAVKILNTQLSSAENDLNNTQIKLKSLEAGLVAGNAATQAS